MKNTIAFLIMAFVLPSCFAARRTDDFPLTLRITSVGMEQSTHRTSSFEWHRMDATVNGIGYSFRVKNEQALRQGRHPWLNVGQYDARWVDWSKQILEVRYDDRGRMRTEKLYVMSEFIIDWPSRKDVQPLSERTIPEASRMAEEFSKPVETSASASARVQLIPPITETPVSPSPSAVPSKLVQPAPATAACKTILTYHSGRTVCLDEDGE